nr:unnamed protein product [Digitaria exilis]
MTPTHALPQDSASSLLLSHSLHRETSTTGNGAFGSVVKARHRATGKFVAIKRLAGSSHAGGTEALLREARFLEDASASGAGAANPFVVGFHGIVRVPGTFVDLRLVMEHVGPNLHDLLRRQNPIGETSPPLPEATVRAAMYQLLTGAKKMHARRIIHRDIKPSNILVAPDCSVLKICDFGLAMSTDDDPPPYEPAGTLGYMAPEMLLDKPDYDERVDAWSLGCVMAELINGWNPFQGLSEEGQLCAIFDVLGAPDDTTWPWFSSTAFATVVMPELDMQRSNLLREQFPETKLSEQGFEVLSGLLTCDPEKRLTAAAALELPWFSNMTDVLLELPKTEEIALPLPKRLRVRFVCAT